MWGITKHSINSKLGVPLNIQIDAQTLLQRITDDSVNHVFRNSGNLGMVFNLIMGGIFSDLNHFTTLDQILASPEALEIIMTSEISRNTLALAPNIAHVFFSTEAIAQITVNSQSLLERLLLDRNNLRDIALRGQFLSYIAESPFNASLFNRVLTISNSFQRRAVASNVATAGTHNINTNTWVASSQNVPFNTLYFWRKYSRNSGAATVSVNDRQNRSSIFIPASSVFTSDPIPVGRFHFGRIIKTAGIGPLPAWTTSDNENGQAFYVA